MSSTRVICFGEVLWDLLPTGKIAGGAPMNVAFHLQNLGIHSSVISQIGADVMGEELLEFLSQKGISTKYITKNYTFPTGTVKVELDDKGTPSYEIIHPVAWDFIHPHDELCDAVKDADALVFGSLACRSERSRETLFELLEIATLRIFDVNLRAPFYAPALIEKLLQNAEIVKLSEDELSIICDWYTILGDEQIQLSQLKEQYDLETIILTKGVNGVVCLQGEHYVSYPAFTVNVEDTIGSGDAFLAAFIYQMLGMNDLEDCLSFASALGALVATRKGAVPTIKEKEILSFMNLKRIKI